MVWLGFEPGTSGFGVRLANHLAIGEHTNGVMIVRTYWKTHQSEKVGLNVKIVFPKYFENDYNYQIFSYQKGTSPLKKEPRRWRTNSLDLMVNEFCWSKG